GDRVIGHWRRSIKDKTVDIEVRLYRSLDKPAKEALEEAVSEFGRFLGREPRLEVARL
ncbi:MAG: hypothetical protein QOH90_745, partial [Actinomycetota bacterium]|nr:hypothetical protein [Actinomycetota bacterium]